jgi:HEAT repeat protein
MNNAIHVTEMAVMATRKADVAELIVMRLSLDAERAGRSRPLSDRKAKLPELWRRLLELSHDSDPNVRRWVIEALRDGSPTKYRRAIVGRLMMLAEDSDARVRRSAQKALESYRDEAQLSFFKRTSETVASK